MWAVAALIAILVSWRRQDRPPSESQIAVTYAAGLIALLIGCDLNEASVHPCPLLGVNIGPLLYALGLAVWFVALTIAAGLVAFLVLAIVWIVRRLRARRAKVDAARTKA